MLRRADGGALEQRGGSIVFNMSDGMRLVPCTVTQGALTMILADHDDPRDVFLGSRRMIERIASEKFAAGALDEDGGITLAAADVLGLFPD